ncbi:hypothetical protein [Methylobacterium bullatum]|uniref:Uncharacterized protein n=1 Tax=Methylobacterium bullatum TaxID=570505 RepID=A0AAV4ZBC3_9HYPH|nr:hypothetical protein [Methylobacterium bullatum]MBD8902776.1 hypothetical protein [Methylobacterium bullatum]GJD41316.1 hypothetical protein OICFNHDK_3799 [Methylobacterium bullatum]
MSSAAVVEQVVATATITTERGASSAVAYQQAATATVANEQGPAGPPGSGIGYDHQQPSPSMLWTVAHNLGARPGVQTFSVGGVEIVGAVQHLSNNVLSIAFVVPVAGYAHVI